MGKYLSELRTVEEGMREKIAPACWHKVTRFHARISEFVFILWLAVRDKLKE